MTEKPDDLEAVRKLVEVLSPFDAGEQERIIRWACEKLGLSVQGPAPAGIRGPQAGSPTGGEGTGGAKDIRTFVAEKNPTSDNQFAATVAHYYRFVASPATRKEFITAEDLQEACRLTGRNRLPRPAQTLINAHTNGLLDKGTNRGEYVISTVGENLVAVSLPGNATAADVPRRTARPRRKGGSRDTRAAKRTRRK
ncbi:MAG: hypothetical protein AB7G48_11205 [Nitrospiraceae bacterium]